MGVPEVSSELNSVHPLHRYIHDCEVSLYFRHLLKGRLSGTGFPRKGQTFFLCEELAKAFSNDGMIVDDENASGS